MSSSMVTMRFRGQGTGVLAHLLPPFAGTRFDRRVVLVAGLAVQHAARSVLFPEGRVLGVVAFLGLLLRIQVVEATVELVEAVHGRKVLVAIAQVVLAELRGRIAMILEQLSNSRILTA